MPNMPAEKLFIQSESSELHQGTSENPHASASSAQVPREIAIFFEKKVLPHRAAACHWQFISIQQSIKRAVASRKISATHIETRCYCQQRQSRSRAIAQYLRSDTICRDAF